MTAERRLRGPGGRLRGRASECALLDDLISAIRRGESRSLVLRGEAGIGKTALLEYLVASAPDATVIRAVGVQSEMELAFASLHQLCGPLLDRLEGLPAPQRNAMEIVFGLTAGEAPDRFLVGLAVLSLFSEVAEQRPLLCVVDDAQWLDQASALTLAFVARRLLAEPVAIVFAAREPGKELVHVSELEVDGVRNGDARALLSSAVRFKLDERVRDRIIAETRGNPLALLELPRGLTARQLAGGFGLVEAQGLAGRIEESFVRRVELLSDDARRLLLLAAAEPVGDPLLLLAASERLGIAVSATDAETDALLAFGERVTFRHPLVRSAVYRTATREQRREVHLALAEATDRSVDPDRRAWHLATAAAGPERAGRRGARAVRRPRAGARRPGRGRGVPASLRRSVGRSRAAGAACACRCPSELARRHVRGWARASGVGRGLDAGRAADGASGTAPGPDRVRVEHGAHCAATALEGRQAPRAARPRARARDLPRRVGSCVLRRSPGLRRQPGRGIPRCQIGSAADAPAPSIRSAARWPQHPRHGRTCGGRATAEAGNGRVCGSSVTGPGELPLGLADDDLGQAPLGRGQLAYRQRALSR